MKVCPRCGSTDIGTRNRCKPCRAGAARAAYAADPTETKAKDAARRDAWRLANPVKVRAQKRKQRYGVTQGEVDEFLFAQGWRCAICREPNPDCVDHDHVTGQVRGILCRCCNAGLGQFRDNPDHLVAAAEYIVVCRAALAA